MKYVNGHILLYVRLEQYGWQQVGQKQIIAEYRKHHNKLP